jgi:hypothetical protein
MITIPIKIKREDKEIMVKLMEDVNTFHFDLSYITGIVTYEIYIETLSRLRASQHNNSSIRLNLVQTNFFLLFLQKYSFLGDYELANALTLTKNIKTAINKKVLTLIQ